MGSLNAAWNRERFWLLVTTLVLLLSFTTFLVFMTLFRATPTPTLKRLSDTEFPDASEPSKDTP